MTVVNNNGVISLKLVVNGKQLWINGLGSYSDAERLAFAREVDERIKRDRRSGQFSFTTAEEVRMYYLPKLEDQRAMLVKMLAQERGKTNSVHAVVEEYQRAGLGGNKIWLVVKLVPEYAAIDSVEWLERLGKRYSTYTYNLVLSVVKRALQWGAERGLCAAGSPILVLKSKRKDYSDILRENRRQPFSLEEIKLIINAFRTDQFVDPCSAYKHSFYADFVEAMFTLGTRPSELIGLQVKQCDFVSGVVLISSVLARNGGRSGRIRKPCKSYETKVLKMTPRLRLILQARCTGRSPDDLVFPAPKGGPIDDHLFTQRIWKKVLVGLGIPYRVFYACRHTFISHGIEQGIPITDIARLVGHSNSTTISRHYARSLKNTPELPVIVLDGLEV